MEIILNDSPKTVSADCNLQTLLDDVLAHKQNGIAVAVNQEVVPKHQWASRRLVSNDQVFIIKATQGG